jgi:hypothetical protein
MAQMRKHLTRIAKTSTLHFSNSLSNVGFHLGAMRKSDRCRRCCVPVKADARRCHSCGAVYPNSELLAVALSLRAVVVYVIGGLAFIALWFLR